MSGGKIFGRITNFHFFFLSNKIFWLFGELLLCWWMLLWVFPLQPPKLRPCGHTILTVGMGHSCQCSVTQTRKVYCHFRFREIFDLDLEISRVNIRFGGVADGDQANGAKFLRRWIWFYHNLWPAPSIFILMVPLKNRCRKNRFIILKNLNHWQENFLWLDDHLRKFIKLWWSISLFTIIFARAIRRWIFASPRKLIQGNHLLHYS